MFVRCAVVSLPISMLSLRLSLLQLLLLLLLLSLWSSLAGPGLRGNRSIIASEGLFEASRV